VLESAVQERVAKLEQELTAARSRKDSLSALDRLVTSFSEVNRPDLALRPQELYYKLEPSAAMRLKTAQLYKEASMLPFLTEDNPVLEGNLKRRSSTLYDEHLKAYPKDLDAQIDRAMVNILPDNPMQGIRQLLTLAEENPGNARVSLELGKFALKSGQFDKAETRLSKAASLEANNWEAHFYLALAQERLDKKKEARSAFEKALALAPNAPLKEMIQAQLTNLRP
jgi:tetratricopeptide (TPR) repeat protein